MCAKHVHVHVFMCVCVRKSQGAYYGCLCGFVLRSSAVVFVLQGGIYLFVHKCVG